MTTAKIKAIVPYFGGKRTLAPLIVRELGGHNQYFEPFCGSMAVLFAKEPSRNETVNDLHGHLICLARTLADDTWAPWLYERLQRALVCEALLDQAQERIEGYDVSWFGEDCSYGESSDQNCRIDENMADVAYWYFIASWMGRNGVAGTARENYQLAVRWTLGGGSPTVRWRSAADSIPAWHERLRNVTILCRDAFKIIPRFEDAKHTAIYVDPPYPDETRTSRSTSGKYLHEFNHGTGGLLGETDDHARLADILRAFEKARIVVSSYDCPRIRKLYDGWTVVPCAIHKAIQNANGRGRRPQEAPEILLVNGPSNTKASTT